MITHHWQGCGGHLKTLRRKDCCGFASDIAVDLERLEQLSHQGRLGEVIIGMNEALHFIPETMADDTLARKIGNGKKLLPDDFPVRPVVSEQGIFKVVDRDRRLLAVMREPTSAGHFIYYCVFSA